MPTKPKISTDKWASFQKSSVVRSPKFEEIMAQYDLVGKAMPTRKFYREYVSKIDSNLSYDAWRGFMEKFRKTVTIDTSKILERTENKAINAIVLEEQTLNKMAILFDLTVDELIADPEKLKQIPLDVRARWFFATMRARDARLRTGLKKRADDREQTAYDELMNNAQYDDDAVDIDATPSEIAQELPVAQIKTMREQIKDTIDPPPLVAFNPETDIDNL